MNYSVVLCLVLLAPIPVLYSFFQPRGALYTSKKEKK